MRQLVTSFSNATGNLDGLTVTTGLFRPTLLLTTQNVADPEQVSLNQQVKVSNIMLTAVGAGAIVADIQGTYSAGVSPPFAAAQAVVFYNATGSGVLNFNCMFEDDTTGRRMIPFLMPPFGALSIVTGGATSVLAQVVWSYSNRGEVLF